MPRIHHTAAIAIAAACTAGFAAAQGPSMGTGIDMLDFRVTDAEFSQSLGRIVAVSNAPDSRVHVYDPLAQAGVSDPLPLPGTCVSVGPDGRRAVVGHDGFVSVVDVATGAVTATLPIGTNCGDVVLAGNGFAYAVPSFGQWERVFCVELATGNVTQSSGFSTRAGTKIRLHPNGRNMYGADNGLSPSDIEKYDIAAGTAQYLYDSPYHGTYAMSGDLWISEDGLRIFVRGAHVFRSSQVRTEDMTYNGSLAGMTLARWIDHSAEAGKVLAIPDRGFSGPPNVDTELRLYDYAFLALDGVFPFPRLRVGTVDHLVHGRHVFFDAEGRRAWAIVEADAASGLLFDHGIVEFRLGPTSDPLSGDVETVSIAAGGAQQLTLDAGTEHAGQLYLVLGSVNGSSPGIPFGDLRLPLNYEPVYFVHTAAAPGTWPLFGSLGTLDAMGRGSARFDLGGRSVPAGVAGTTVHHAYVLFDAGLQLRYASNAVRVRILP
jgi:hypothetical protein